jgi:hypothetical protein
MANTKIPSELIADSSITAAKLADGTITTYRRKCDNWKDS